MLHAVIFDVDGTLVDSNDLHARAWQEAFAQFGIELRYDRVRSQIGKGADQLIPSLIPAKQAKRIGKELAEYRAKLFNEKYLDQVRPFPKVRELFQRILKDGRRIVLATSAKEEELHKLRQIAQIDDLIDDETTSDDADKSKPHPDIIQAALRCLKVPPDEAIMVGDSPYDAMAATTLHVRTIGLLCGGFSEAELRHAGCVEIYRDPANLLDHYEKSALLEVPAAA